MPPRKARNKAPAAIPPPPPPPPPVEPDLIPLFANRDFSTELHINLEDFANDPRCTFVINYIRASGNEAIYHAVLPYFYPRLVQLFWQVVPAHSPEPPLVPAPVPLAIRPPPRRLLFRRRSEEARPSHTATSHIPVINLDSDDDGDHPYEDFSSSDSD